MSTYIPYIKVVGQMILPYDGRHMNRQTDATMCLLAYRLNVIMSSDSVIMILASSWVGRLV